MCTQYTELTQFDGDLWKSGFESEALKNLKSSDGKTLADHLALLIGSVGENATIKRAICFKVNNDLKLSGYAHPQAVAQETLQNVTQLGKDKPNPNKDDETCLIHQEYLIDDERTVGEYFKLWRHGTTFCGNFSDLALTVYENEACDGQEDSSV
ncbi:Elongation factor Ts, mitochondrial [Eumeta japonica]|uniref:Elongation factor Ts, mitochondrial n=1 Tax=Eumeta variegata TaxID=151549 RepID=A0A4C1SWX1_EUMVA|nr:Elongation factor Ts, mitochondrial [Eumeta japonica]